MNSRFRIQNPVMISSFSHSEKKQIQAFQAFINQKPDGYCCVCMKLLYPEDRRYRRIEDIESVPCLEWKLQPINKDNTTDFYMVCKSHLKTPEIHFPRFRYPGDVLPETSHLNYREKSVLSPIKLFSQITRKSTLRAGRIGHYELTGAINRGHSYEFAEMAYGGTLGLFFQRDDPASIDKEKVKLAYNALQRVNPLLCRYLLPKLTYSLISYHIRESQDHLRVDKGWKNNILFSNDDTNPQACDVEFIDLIIGEDTNGKSIRYAHPSLMALVFPWLFPLAIGHYSLVPRNTPEADLRRGIYSIPEENGGVAFATLQGETVAAFFKSRLMMKDRRFARDPSFLFYGLDTVEKLNIASANRFIVSSKGKANLKQSDVVSSATGKMNQNLVSMVPSTIRSSYAYKRKNFLDLQCIFENMGGPQLFLTFTCDDKSPDFRNLSEASALPWEDPVLFSLHFKRKWSRFFSQYVLKNFGDSIGGIKEYSWVLEVQDRGSPHIHCVLWTNKSVGELIELDVVHTWIPQGTSYTDPFMHDLVTRLQIHRCNVRYCQRGDPSRKCRFSFPKPFAPTTDITSDGKCVYKRHVGDEMVNNYHPYLLSVFQTSMDIQYNDGPQAVRYLAKYLAKDDYGAQILINNSGRKTGYIKKPNYVSEKDHLSSRIVGAVEACYDLLSWHKHTNSRNVIYVNTNLIQNDSRRIRPDIKSLPEESEDIYSRTHIEIYESRDDAPDLTLPQFFSFYQRSNSPNEQDKEVTRPFYNGYLSNTVNSCGVKYVLRKTKPLFWGTFNQSEMNGENFYYQQVVLKKAIFGMTFEQFKGDFRSWKDYYEYLINLGANNGGIEVHRVVNIQTIDDVVDAERGLQVSQDEFAVMYKSANIDQKAIFKQIISEMKTNSVSFVSGAAGTGKSYVLRMLERYYRVKKYKVFKMAPTGVAANNISGMTIHRFFGLTNRASVPNFQKLDIDVKTYRKMVFLIDEYSMISIKLLESLNESLIKSTQRNSLMGGIKTIFFGDIAQLLPVDKFNGSIWESEIYNSVMRYNLNIPVRQQDLEFINVLNKVRLGEFDEEVVMFINSRTFLKKHLPLQSLRLYTTRELVNKANEKDNEEFPGEIIRIDAHDTYMGNKGTATQALKNTGLAKSLFLKIDMPVMIIQNINVTHGWVNGTIAQIEYIDDDNICLRKRFGEDEDQDSIYYIQRITRQVPGTSYTRSQFPIVTAFACTIHKAQSATIDRVAIHLDNMLTHGQLYVAMSRVKKASDLYFFGSEIPLAIKRKYGVDCDAIEIVRKKAIIFNKVV